MGVRVIKSYIVNARQRGSMTPKPLKQNTGMTATAKYATEHKSQSRVETKVKTTENKGKKQNKDVIKAKTKR